MTRTKIRSYVNGWNVFAALGLLLLMNISALAQLPTGTILGTVKDPSGAVVAGATVTVTNADTSFTRDAKTEADGSYRLPALPVGNYQLRITHEGFQTEERKGLTLEVAQEAVIDVTLEVGSTSQTVTVTEAVPLVDTTSASVGGTVDEARVADLPLNGRNWTDLTLLQAGVTKINIFTGNAASMNLNGTLYSSNGGALRSNMYLLDGADTRTFQGLNNTSITNTTLGVDGIKEYKVVTILPDASYGLTMGSQTSLVSKGGTNQWHGDAFEYLRNASLDARNYFDALDTKNVNGFGTEKSVVYPGKRIPPFRRNNFGGSFGGPIKKDKAFFYGVYEGIRQELGVTITKTTLPKACFVDSTGILQPVVPAKILNVNSIGTCATGAAATINVNQYILPLADLFPQPNVFGYPTFNYTFPYLSPTQENYGQMRGDYNFSNSDSAFIRYTQDDADEIYNYTYKPFNIALHSASHFATLSESHVFTASLLNTFRFSFSRQVATLFNLPNLTDANLLLVPIAVQESEHVPLPGFGSESPGSGVSSLGSNPSPQYGNDDLFTWSDDVYWTKGKHAFKFGTLLNYEQAFTYTCLSAPGGISFASLANYFVGDYSSYSVSPPAGSNCDRDFHISTYGMYAQDDYRVSSRLTLNLGLRYEFSTVPHEQNPAVAYQIRFPATDTAPTPGPLFLNPSMRDFSPRFGFAWDPFGKGKTSIRGGAGIYYDIGNFGNTMVNNSIDGPPASFQVLTTNTAATPLIPFAIPFPAAGATAPPSARSTQWHLGQPSLLQRSLTVDQQLPWSMGLTLSYVGSQGWHLWQVREANNTIPAGVNAQGLPFYYCYNANQSSRVLPGANGACAAGFSSAGPRTNPVFGQVALAQTEGNSYYNSLQVQLNKRISQGLQFQFNYTWSRLLDTGQGVAFTETGTEVWQVPVGYANLSDRGPATFDTPQNLRVNLIYHAPLMRSDRIVSKAANGWWFSSIVSAQSGYPITPSLGSDRALQNDVQEVERPNLDASFNRSTAVEGTVAQWFNPTMFDVPIAGTLGNEGRGLLRGPGLLNVDFSIVKDTKAAFLGEAGNIEFRAEVFNLLNHSDFALPSASLWTAGTPTTSVAGQIGTTANPMLSTAGQITSTIVNSRQIQFAVKILF